MFVNIRIIRNRAITAYPSGNDLRHNMIADDDNGPARNGILLRPETDASDGNLTRSFVPRPIALCPTTLEVRGPLFSTVPDIQDLNLCSEKSIEKRYNIEKSHLKNVT